MRIVLIGPCAAGKTTVSRLLARRLDLPYVPLDEIRFDYYREIGYDDLFARRLRREQGFPALARFWKPFDIHSVERALADYRQGVIDFGAGHSVYDDEEHFRRVRTALAAVEHVILLVPDPDIAISLRILGERDPIAGKYAALNEHFLRHPSNWTLATAVVFTKVKTPESVCEEIVDLIGKIT